MARQSSTLLEISRARHRAELVTDDANALREHLETATGDRVAALEGIAAEADRSPERSVGQAKVDIDFGEPDRAAPPQTLDRAVEADPTPVPDEPQPASEREKAPEPLTIDDGLGL